MFTAIIEPTDDHWMQALSNLRYDFYHLPQYATLEAKRIGGKAVALYANNDRYQALLPLIFTPTTISLDSFDATSPYGYPGPITNFLIKDDNLNTDHFINTAISEWLKHLNDNNVVTCFIRHHPILQSLNKVFSLFGQLTFRGETVSFDLSKSNDEIWDNIKVNHRSEIKKTEQLGFEIEVDANWKRIEDFILCYNLNMDRVNAKSLYYFSREYYSNFIAALSGKSFLISALYNGKMTGAAIFTEFNGIVQLHLGCTFSDYLKNYPHKLLYYKVALWAKERGNTHLHLGGGLGGSNDSLFTFKSRFSPLRHQFFTSELIINQETYNTLSEKWKGEHPEVNSNYFPLYKTPL